MLSATMIDELPASEIQLEKNQTVAAQAKEKRPRHALKLVLEDGATLVLKKKRKRIDKTTQKYYVDETTNIAYIIKNTRNLFKEYLGSIAFRALGIDVPNFFLASYKQKEGEYKIFFMQELVAGYQIIDLYGNENPLWEFVPEMIRMITAAELLGDTPGFCFNSRHIRIANGKLYKIDNSEIFHYVDGKPKSLAATLFDPQRCQHQGISTTLTILARHDFQDYKKTIENFFASFNALQLRQQIMSAYEHPFLTSGVKEMSQPKLQLICDNIVNAVECFSSDMKAIFESLKVNPANDAVPYNQASELNLHYQSSEFYQQSIMVSPFYQSPEFYELGVPSMDYAVDQDFLDHAAYYEDEWHLMPNPEVSAQISTMQKSQPTQQQMSQQPNEEAKQQQRKTGQATKNTGSQIAVAEVPASMFYLAPARRSTIIVTKSDASQTAEAASSENGNRNARRSNGCTLK